MSKLVDAAAVVARLGVGAQRLMSYVVANGQVRLFCLALSFELTTRVVFLGGWCDHFFFSEPMRTSMEKSWFLRLAY